MTEKRLTISISAVGKTTIDAKGYTGGQCAEATKSLETMLGAGDGGVERIKKPEWDQLEVQTEGEQTLTW